MNQYLENWKLYFLGFGRLGQLHYREGWNKWWMLIPYCTTYLLGTLCGFGVISLSRYWYNHRHQGFSRFMTRLLNWLFPGKHGVMTFPALWGSKSVW